MPATLRRAASKLEQSGQEKAAASTSCRPALSAKRQPGISGPLAGTVRHVEQRVVHDPHGKRVDVMARHAVGEEEGPVAAHEPGVALHDFEAGPHVGREVFLVDDEDIRLADARPALAGDLVPSGHVDNVDEKIRQCGTERKGQVIAAAFDKADIKKRMLGK